MDKGSSPLVEGHVGGVLAKAHHIAAPSIPQHVIDLLLPVSEQEGRIHLVTLHHTQHVLTLHNDRLLCNGLVQLD